MEGATGPRVAVWAALGCGCLWAVVPTQSYATVAQLHPLRNPPPWKQAHLELGWQAELEPEQQVGQGLGPEQPVQRSWQVSAP